MREYPSIPRTYELMTILSPEVSEEDVPTTLETIAGYIRSQQASLFEVLRDAPWGRRRLAYSIRYHGRDVRDGFYTIFRFESVPENIAEIERDLKLNDSIMRHMLVTIELPDTEPRPEEIQEGDLLKVATPAPAEGEEGAPAAAADGEATEAPVVAEAPAAEAAETPAAAEAPAEAPATETTEQPVTPAEPAESAPVQETTTANEPSDAPASDAAPAEEPAAPASEEAPAAAEETESKEG